MTLTYQGLAPLAIDYRRFAAGRWSSNYIFRGGPPTTPCGAVHSTTTRTTCSPRTGTTTTRRTRTTISGSAWQAPETVRSRGQEPRPQFGQIPLGVKAHGTVPGSGTTRPSRVPALQGRQAKKKACAATSSIAESRGQADLLKPSRARQRLPYFNSSAIASISTFSTSGATRDT
jgi:hypothetical protein